MKCKRCDGTGYTGYFPATWNGPEEYVDCDAGCVECSKCYVTHVKVDEHGWCFDCLNNYDGPGDDHYSDFYGGGQATQEQRNREAAEEKRKLG